MELKRIHRKYFQKPEDLAASMAENEIVIEMIPHTDAFMTITAGGIEEYDSFEDLPVEVQNVLIETDKEVEDIDEPTRFGSTVDYDDEDYEEDLADVKNEIGEEEMYAESKVLKFNEFNKINENKNIKKKVEKINEKKKVVSKRPIRRTTKK